ncbi:NLP/P60 protein [Caldithrix abyssi DSM 13497]|uniref:Cell wall-associated hydrolase, NlpC family n=1 Tax=Caldithrix abyssi DSM 13497 TaxID=880073 RepID=H1XT00_CALAY|nr:C40 family peptidase [Caldithrix abyssi]APF17308.1 Cell wall-associated hydrolase, NlpC family [Caldithrix abyssi DSM 13497]EHO41429.1 NLP/P60 protein [Caldithrix abyssi DSM 13497]
MNRRILFFILFTALIISCNSDRQALRDFDRIKQQVRQQFAPDKSLAVFDFHLQKENGQWVLTGETTVPQARTALLQKLDSLLQQNVHDQSLILPHPDLGDSSWAIVRVSVANLRRDPAHTSELVDQSIMGNVLRLLKRYKSWYLVQTHYGYLGWMTKYSFVRTDQEGVENWQKARRIMVYWPVDRIYSEPSDASVPVVDVVMNCTLKELNRRGKWILVETPDQRRGYILKKHVGPLVEKRDPSQVSSGALLNTAFQLMGIPYLWGGNSAKGSDCSGFTQTAFKHHGIQLPRDARQQALLGEEVVPAEDFSNVMPGDLLFFGQSERITHVGISLGGYKFIHQDREVRINSFNPQDDDFNAYRKKTLKLIKRILK